ncbi:cysteine desulfurase family protein [Kocuria rhizophila]|uniref:Cysteine desulfurase n=1 Tax=Kocuria rhizophila (strain ATCC 9341 / DSM 348 / NBRC 103217 / DC2201) TaxID=378753 RepID=B2GL47_KOCRD|nr:cysteine desulfurase family protein [Kocuria rhizophila]ASE10838.1 cysteine desulfurase [Kocuria rhizophila]BAG29223.1 cysteine desulfurase [Kocuria rhizophila DC2201]VEH75496.1 Cysteine desulfurase [Kocuria rhizophila]
MPTPRIYMDHAATTDMLPEAVDAYLEQARRGGNPASLHSGGRSARMALETGRDAVAGALNAEPVEIILTSGGTEADNMAVLGLFRAAHEADPRRTVIALSAVEHHAVSEAAEWLAAHEGAELVWLDVDAAGRVDPHQLERLLAERAAEVALVTVMWANNEVGTVQPVAELAALCDAAGVSFHVDAVQAFCAVPVDAHLPGISTLAVSAHKLGGPMGVGALYAPRTVRLAATSFGGGQERSVRSGTVNAAGAAAFGAAVEAAQRAFRDEFLRRAALRDALVAGIRDRVPEAVLRGPEPGSPTEEWEHPTRLPGNAHFTFPGCEGDSMLFLFDAAGVALSTGSACSAGVPRASHVLLAMGVDEETARGAQRFSLGHSSTREDVDTVLDAVVDVHARARAAGLSGHVPGAFTS